MRNTSRPVSPMPSGTPPVPKIPTIRLTHATPSASSHLHDETLLSPNSIASESPESIRRYVKPKMSKLSMLTGSRREKEFTDITRRLGVGHMSSGVDMYVDPNDDPDIGEIVVVKKKKSRATLDGIRWALGDKTNTNTTGKEEKEKKKTKEKMKDEGSKTKGEESSKWWTIGRGRKDSKEKQADKARPKSPGPNNFQGGLPTPPPSATRPEMNPTRRSIDSAAVLASESGRTTPATTLSGAGSRPITPMSMYTNSRAATPALVVPMPDEDEDAKDKERENKPTGSLALRAMRSVRSLARIKSWAQLKPGHEKERRGKMSSESTSSWEVGEISIVRSLVPGAMSPVEGGTMRSFASGRTGSSAGPSGRLSTGSAHVQGRAPATQRLSTLSTASSLAPVSTYSSSSDNRSSRYSSGSDQSRPLSALSVRSGESVEQPKRASRTSSIRWDESNIETVKEKRKGAKERRGGTTVASRPSTADGTSSRRSSKSSVRSSEGRQRGRLSNIFPEVVVQPPASPSVASTHSTPPRPAARPRPLSENLLSTKPRPSAIIIQENGDPAISILNAATSDLASLIDRLDLQATPETPFDRTRAFASRENTDIFGTPKDKAPASPSKRSPKEMSSTASLRPYSKREAATSQVDLRLRDSIATDDTVSSYGPVFSLPDNADQAFVLQPLEEEEPGTPSMPVFTTQRNSSPPSSPVLMHSNSQKRLRLALTKSRSQLRVKPSKLELVKPPTPPHNQSSFANEIPVFRSSLSSEGSRPNSGDLTRSFSAIHSSEGGSVVNSRAPSPKIIKTRAEMRKYRGYNGTFGEFDDLDVTDPDDSDIPDELQSILTAQPSRESISLSDAMSARKEVAKPVSPLHVTKKELKPEPAFHHKRSVSLRGSPSPGLPPAMPLPEPSRPKVSPLGPPVVIERPVPIFRALLVDENDRHEAITGSEPTTPRTALDGDTTKKSFDFTTEISRLTEVGDADKESFLEQLERAFKTPAKLTSFDFDRDITVPPFNPQEFAKTLDFSSGIVNSCSLTHNGEATRFEDVHPTSNFRPISEYSELSCYSTDNTGPSPLIYQGVTAVPRTAKSSESSSIGELNASFKFGNLGSLAGPMALSDAQLPKLELTRKASQSLVEEDSSVMKSIYTHAVELPDAPPPPVPSLPRLRVASDNSSKREARESAMNSLESRPESIASFEGLPSFADVRNKFEFSGEGSRVLMETGLARKHVKQESVFSIASVSSYGQVLNAGLPDPFNYTAQSRPASIDMSQTVNDTFAFLKQDPNYKRRSVDSDASSFYFRPPAGNGHRRGRQNESIASIMSSAGPPVSMYNRSNGVSFGHGRNDSWASGSSLAHAYAQGANGGRAAWARHYRDNSADQTGDSSIGRLGRPGLGDKMLSSALEHGATLSSISASPPESANGSQRDLREKSSWDSLLDEERVPSTDSLLDQTGTQPAMDSLFDRTGHRTSASSDSIFGHDAIPRRVLPLPDPRRPISMLSVTSSSGSEEKDDTMYTMLNGDRVRRRSLGSSFEASPLFRADKRLGRPTLTRIESVGEMREKIDYEPEPEMDTVPEVSDVEMARGLVSAPSIQFGEDRMEMARRGGFNRYSLEQSCLMSDGPDISVSLGPPVLTVLTRSTSRPASVHSEVSVVSSESGTPPLYQSDGSQSGGSQSSIDMAQLNALLTNVAQPTAPTGARVRPRGQGHRRGQSLFSGSSNFSLSDPIPEERPIASEMPLSPQMISFGAGFESLTASEKRAIENSVRIVEEDTEDETNYVLRRYWALRSEADETVAQSKIIWQDTPFSVYALQTFLPPHDPSAMKAMLEHSRTTYGPLPLELRVPTVRSRTSSRASPYPQRQRRTSIEKEVRSPPKRNVLQPRIVQHNSPVPTLEPIKPMTPFGPVDLKKSTNRNQNQDQDFSALTKPSPGTRRQALGWSKRKTPKKADRTGANKENDISMVMSPADASLRLNRPRPRGRVR